MKIKVLPCQDDLEEIALRDKCSVVGVEEMSITYTQPADTNSCSDDIQFITVTSKVAASVAENEEGFYFDISIPEGQHWSVDSGEELKALIDDFKNRLYMKTEQL